MSQPEEPLTRLTRIADRLDSTALRISKAAIIDDHGKANLASHLQSEAALIRAAIDLLAYAGIRAC